MNDEGCAPGRLTPLVVAGEPALSAFTSKQLAAELHARLRSGAMQGSHVRYDPDVDGFTALAREILRRFDVDADRFSRTNASVRFTSYWAGDPPPVKSFEGATVVELGCGSRNPLSVLFLFVLLGARRAIGVDLDGVEDVSEAVRALARCAAWLLTDPKRIVGDFPTTREQVARRLAETEFDLGLLAEGDPRGVDRARLDLRHVSAARLDLADGEVDLCGSSSFLEHVDDVEATIAEMARITKRDGRGAHSIDGVDHRSYNIPVRPVEFLEMETADRIVHGCNRMRPLHFAPIFERHGFEVRRIQVWRRDAVDDETRKRMVEPFRSMSREDLECTGASIWVRKR